ncbi:hypothetical protein PP713_13870 [Mycobacterium sp. CSUR Q5927]|nr:hypothetical protein [Mycobacterium sp. CSUR Q5927]
MKRIRTVINTWIDARLDAFADAVVQRTAERYGSEVNDWYRNALKLFGWDE